MRHRAIVRTLAAGILALAGFAFAGCEQDEEVLDIDTPDGGVEIERDGGDGSLEVETDE